MSQYDELQEQPLKRLPSDDALRANINSRRQLGKLYRWILLSSIVIALLALTTLLINITNDSFGLVALEYRRDPDELGPAPFAELDRDQLTTIIVDNVSRNRLRVLEREAPLADRSDEELRVVILEEVARQRVVESYKFFESVFNRAEIEERIRESRPNATIEFRSWVSWSFITTPMSSRPEFAGIRTALMGSLWMIGITILVAFPLGVGAAIYLEEYATQNRISRIIQTNINNLAGVPSIIYGMLGLAIFVRALGNVTSGNAFGIPNDNGRTILSASLTMALLVLPLIIINAQEAIRAVPRSLRQASYALGATRWQTIWHHVLPVAFPGILTGNILAMSRAIGETAPLIVVGASTFITFDPSGPFSKFTALPIQIYNWTAQPQAEFRSIAAAAIIVLLVMLLSLNSFAIILRNRMRKSF
jgi:phosphate transport system permease protein